MQHSLGRWACTAVSRESSARESAFFREREERDREPGMPGNGEKRRDRRGKFMKRGWGGGGREEKMEGGRLGNMRGKGRNAPGNVRWRTGKNGEWGKTETAGKSL